MTFTKACFIRKNTPELRNKLKELGYEPSENDGRKIISNDWWHQGKIPEEFKDLMSDNAKWIK